MKNQLADFYLDYLNNFLTIGAFAAHHGMDESTAQSLVNFGREFHNERTAK